MSEDLRKKKSEVLLKLALEEQLEQEEDIRKYTEEEKNIHKFSKKHEKHMRKILKMAEKANRKEVYKKVAVGIVIVFSSIILMRNFEFPQICFLKKKNK